MYWVHGTIIIENLSITCQRKACTYNDGLAFQGENILDKFISCVDLFLHTENGYKLDEHKFTEAAGSICFAKLKIWNKIFLLIYNKY